MSMYTDWFLASRPWSFTMTAISVGVGGALAASHGPFSWPLFLATLIGAVCMHASANLFNDYYDVLHGVDTPETATAQYRPHPLVLGAIPARQVFAAASALLALGAAIGLVLAYMRGQAVLWIGLAGAIAAFAYTAPPLRYKYLGLGEVSVFLMWGPLMVEGAYYVQRGGLSLQALFISIPFGILVALVLLANNIRDISHDRKSGITTIANTLGEAGSLRLYLGLMGAAFMCIPLFVIAGILPVWGFAIFLSLPVAVGLARSMAMRPPKDADARTAKLDTVFGALLLAVLVVQAFLA